jgi:8-oxo-dGTP pyrophosphatase MutT (NUDIX family)
MSSPLTPDDRLVLVRQYRHAVGECLLELPGGAVDAEDDGLENAARRELAEETGFRASDWRFVSSLYPNPATHTNRVHFYVATGAEHEGPQILEEGEEGMTVHLLPVPEVLAGLHAGILGQVMHVTAVLLGLALAGRITLKD